MRYYHQNWPVDLHPDVCPVYSFNQLKIGAEKESIWSELINAKKWCNWYDNCNSLEFLSHKGPYLQLGTEFTWKTFSVKVRTVVEEFETNHILGWRGWGLAAEGYHVWLIEEQADGCLVTTEETQKGAIPWLLRWVFRKLLLKYHQKWLEGLANQLKDTQLQNI